MMNNGVTTVMKFRTLKRHFREGVKNIFRNGWMSVASIGAVTVTLVLVSAFLTIMLNLNEMAKKVEEDVEINALIDLTASKEDIKALGKEIEKLDDIDSVVFSSNDEELRKFMDSMGDEGDSWGLLIRTTLCVTHILLKLFILKIPSGLPAK
ncbi:Cell division protein [Lentibacillus sp. JNUCC-1]|nr:Cell division protein [Lentibacillus sp. JNUCC-1]